MSGKVVKAGANAVRTVTPISSVNRAEARLAVLQVYKELYVFSTD